MSICWLPLLFYKLSNWDSPEHWKAAMQWQSPHPPLAPVFLLRRLLCYFLKAVQIQNFQQLNQAANRLLETVFSGNWLFAISNAIGFLYLFVHWEIKYFIQRMDLFYRNQIRSDQISRSVVSNSLRPHESQHTRPPFHHQLPEFTETQVHWVSDAIQPSHPMSSPSPPAPNPSQHQSLFQWVNSSHQVAKVLEFQL